jgi:hypothetical protein
MSLRMGGFFRGPIRASPAGDPRSDYSMIIFRPAGLRGGAGMGDGEMGDAAHRPYKEAGGYSVMELNRKPA